MEFSHQRARTVFLAIAGLFTLLLLLFLGSVSTVGNGDIVGATIFAGAFLAVLILTYRGYGWAKWLLGSAQLLFGGLFMAFGFDENRIELKITLLPGDGRMD